MRETELWERLNKHLGPTYSHVWASQTVLPDLGRTVEEAMSDGIAFKRIWKAVWLALELPDSER